MKKQTKKEAILEIFQTIENLVVKERRKMSNKDKLIYEQVHVGVMLLSK